MDYDAIGQQLEAQNAATNSGRKLLQDPSMLASGMAGSIKSRRWLLQSGPAAAAGGEGGEQLVPVAAAEVGGKPNLPVGVTSLHAGVQGGHFTTESPVVSVSTYPVASSLPAPAADIASGEAPVDFIVEAAAGKSPPPAARRPPPAVLGRPPPPPPAKVVDHSVPVAAPTGPGPLPIEVAAAAGVLLPQQAAGAAAAGVLLPQQAGGAAAAAALALTQAASQAAEAAATAADAEVIAPAAEVPEVSAAAAVAAPEAYKFTPEDQAKLAKVSNPTVCRMLLVAFRAPPAQLGNSICNRGPWNTKWCSYDMGDCCRTTCKPDVVSLNVPALSSCRVYLQH